MKGALLIANALFALVVGETCDSRHEELVLSLNKRLLRSTEGQNSLPDPSVHIALRLSPHHNLIAESKYLNLLKSTLHDEIESSLNKGEHVIGQLALYILALRASCHDVNTLSLTVNQSQERLLTQLKWQLEEEKAHISTKQHPATSYYQYSLGILALCVSRVKVNPHVTKKLLHAVDRGLINQGKTPSTDAFAMVGLALQCLKDVGTPVQDEAQLDRALTAIKEKLLESQRTDGHLGNEFSTGLAVQALEALGSPVDDCSAPMKALRAEARKGSYGRSAVLSQILPALQRTTYLQLRGKECRKEDDSLVVEVEPTVGPTSILSTTVPVQVEVVRLGNVTTTFLIDVPFGSSLLDALMLLQDSQKGFTFEVESSRWGPVLRSVNGEQAQQSKRRYWHLSSEGTALSQGVKDYKIETAQKIAIRNTGY
ncbi:transcobalamin-2 isoform X2 [Chanos chanos]|nr:transcobalamin-2-like isoform X2 [Chanos chanos]XP_030647379.1 transcobalamin-2-like isoform X2 [Chanos chanos]XP_030647380.1 transcobalamin-2-like isoform X2 [Chanos chanos]XP_030647381.1 transcobalamin-2-like isoform X2 [Chanos chanos]